VPRDDNNGVVSQNSGTPWSAENQSTLGPIGNGVAGSSTARARESRRRKKDGLRQITVELFEREIDEFAQHGLLATHERGDKIAVSHALYLVIEAALGAIQSGTLAIKTAKGTTGG